MVVGDEPPRHDIRISFCDGRDDQHDPGPVDPTVVNDTSTPTDPRRLVVMGVSACGKSTVARILAERLGYRFLEGDDLHSAANVAKMSSGVPLDDADRLPWLRAIARGMRQSSSREGVVVACSALTRRYRDILRDGVEATFFIHLEGDVEVLRARVLAREHSFMPASLLDSQLATLEPLGTDEFGMRVNFDRRASDIVDDIMKELKRTSPR